MRPLPHWSVARHPCGLRCWVVGALPDRPVESFAGIGNRFSSRKVLPGERVLRPGGRLPLTDIADGRTVPAAARQDVDLWTGRIARGLRRAGWQTMLDESGFDSVVIGEPVGTFAGATTSPSLAGSTCTGSPFLVRRR